MASDIIQYSDTLYRWADQLPPALWDDVRHRPPGEAADAVGAQWDGESFHVTLLATRYRVRPASRQIVRSTDTAHPVGFQTGVVLLSALSFSKGVPPSNRMALPQELPGGRLFFTGPHAVPTDPLATFFHQHPNRFHRRAVEIGGNRIQGADLAFRFSGLPYVPLYTLLWQGDQEYPARAVIGIDDRAHFHLDLASVFALTNVLAQRLLSTA